MTVVTVSNDSWVAQAVGGSAQYGNGTGTLKHVGPVPAAVSGNPDYKSRAIGQLDLTAVLTGATSVTSAIYTETVGPNTCMGSRGGTIRILFERLTNSFNNKTASGDCGLSSGTGSGVWSISNNVDSANSALHSSSSHSTGDQITWDITALCQALLDEGPDDDGNYILYYRLISANSDGSSYDETTAARRIALYSVRHGTSGNRPFLTITTSTGSVAKSASDSFSTTETRSITNTGSGTVDVDDAFAVTDTVSYGGQSISWSTVAEEDGYVGQLVIPVVDQESLALLDGVVEDDVLLQCRFKIDQTPLNGQCVFRVMARALDSQNRYQLSVNVSGQQVMTLLLAKYVDGVATVLATFSDVATFEAGEYYWIKLLVRGFSPTSLSAKLWATIGSEPNWQLSATDSEASLQTTGTVGLGARVFTGVTTVPLTFNFDDFTGIAQ